MRYYSEKRYQEALDLTIDAASRFPEYDAKTSFWIACLQSRLGRPEEAIQMLQDAIARKNWWPVEALQDNDLDPIRARPEFQKIQEECERLKHEQPLRKPELFVQVPAGSPGESGWPTLVVFHQRYGERPELSSAPWRCVLSNGMLLAAPWSSQVHAADGRCWDDVASSERDVKWALSELRARHPLNMEKVVVGGFSQGGALSIYSALKGLVRCLGFIAVAPSDWISPEKRAVDRAGPSGAFTSVLKSLDCRGVRGVIIMGESDSFLPKIEPLYRLMVERGLQGRLVVEPGLGHDYPEGFDTKLESAIDFVLGRTEN